jgi:hypothetical protein
MYLAQNKTQVYFILYSLKISRLVFLQNNGIQVAVVSFNQGQRYPKNTPPKEKKKCIIVEKFIKVLQLLFCF